MRKLKTYLGRVIRDIARKIDGDPGLETAFARLLSLARRVRAQERGQRGPKVYSLHAPEVECIGKGKAHKPYEFGVKVSVATTLKHSKGGQFVVHAQALPGNPYDGHTLAGVIPAIEQLVGNTIERLHADAGYRVHNAPPDYKSKIYTSKQKRRVTPQIKREMRRRSAIEPVIGHTKNEHRMERYYFAAPLGAIILLGMVSYFAGVVQAPITAFVIVTEMTQNHNMVLPLMVASLIAYASSRLVCPEGIYHALAKSFLHREAASPDRMTEQS